MHVVNIKYFPAINQMILQELSRLFQMILSRNMYHMDAKVM
jgi:hypothetical protein